MNFIKNLAFASVLFLLINNSFAQRSGVEISGDIIQVSLPVLALGSTYFYPANDKPHWQFLKTYALATIITRGLKPLVNETRPNGGKHSFPSGHSTSAFAGATFLQIRYGWKIGIPAYLLASYVAYTRIYAHKHYIWDVTAGAFIGIGSALIFTKKFPKKFQTTLNYTQGYYLVGLDYRF